MAGRIPQQFIDDLVSRIDIVDLIDQYVPLRKGGRDYVACCPFHQEKSPSFTVSRSKQFYHCFGCQAHGTVIQFMMEYLRLDFVDAIHELAQRAGVEVPQTSDGAGAAGGQRPLLDALQQASEFYCAQLRRPPDGQRAIDYLKARGVTGETAASYALGYAPPGWDGLIKALLPKFSEQTLLAAGLVLGKERGGNYDRFRDRIMFPIRDPRGRVIGFGGRVLDQGTPKYLNSPETAVFHKGHELYGLFEARQALRHPQRLLVVEGYMDVIMLAHSGIHYAVATLGTATTRDHLEQLYRIVPEVVFCFDGDRAGRDAAWRALEVALDVIIDGRQARFMFLPDGEDPDSLVRSEGRQAFEARIAQALPLSGFMYQSLATQVDLSALDGRSRLVELARPLLKRLPGGVFKHLMIEDLARRVGMEAGSLATLLGEAATAGTAVASSAGAPARSGQQRVRPSLMRRVVAMLLQAPALAAQVSDPSRLARIDVPGMALLVEMLDLLHQQPHLTTAALLERWRGKEQGRYLEMLTRQESLIDDPQALQAEFAGAVQRLLRQSIEQRIDQLNLVAGQRSWNDSEKDELRLLQQMKAEVE
ncbi:MAG: DNA primase [Gammaproteobacteria bacterium]|nr:DNA primase [Gammaproteobacteria bacterium]